MLIVQNTHCYLKFRVSSYLVFSVIIDYYTITILNSPIHIHGNTPGEWLLCQYFYDQTLDGNHSQAH